MKRLTLLLILFLTILLPVQSWAAFRSVATNSTATTDLIVTKPSGVVEGDVLIAFGITDDIANDYVWPSGFVAITGSAIITTADNQALGAAIKIAGASEPANYTISSTNALIGGIIAFSGNSATQPHRSSVANNNSANASPWTITSTAYSSTTSVACDLVTIVGSDVTTSVDAVHTGPAGFTVRADIISGFRNLAVSSNDAVAAGASGVLAVTGTLGGASAGWGIFSVALENTGGGGGDEITGFYKRRVQ